MSDELNVWDAAFIAWDGFPTDPSKIGDADQAAAAVIRTYGDERHVAGYQAAIADVAEWLRRENGLCDCFARAETECACGAWDDYKQWSLDRTADEITRRFGKGQDHG